MLSLKCFAYPQETQYATESVCGDTMRAFPGEKGAPALSDTR